MNILIGIIRSFKFYLLYYITTSLDVCVRQYLLCWFIIESNGHGTTILYATHTINLIDDRVTHIHYLTDEGTCRWQGDIKNLDTYQKLKEENHPSKMLAIAGHWLREELERNHTLGRTVKK